MHDVFIRVCDYIYLCVYVGSDMKFSNIINMTITHKFHLHIWSNIVNMIYISFHK